MSNSDQGHNSRISKPMEPLSEERLESVTGGRDDETQYDVVLEEPGEIQARCRKGLMDPNKPGELRVCERCEYWKLFVKNLDELGYTYYECMYKI